MEMSFKAFIHTVGGFSYHFWMKSMNKLKRGSGTQHPHKKDDEYRENVRQKMDTYHSYVNLAAISQGLLCYLAINHSSEIWESFGTWMRTIRRDIAPSEFVTSEALRHAFPEYLRRRSDPYNFKKFLAEKRDPRKRVPELQSVA